MTPLPHRTFGLTGGIACGKSTVAHLLREAHQIPVIDADQVSRDLVEPGTPALQQLVTAFGASILHEDGRLHRERLRTLMVEDSGVRSTLNGIMHPAIFREVRRRLALFAAGGQLVVGVEAALMIEAGSYTQYDPLVVVSCHPDVQMQRLMARNQLSEEQARAMMAIQMPLTEKERLADELLFNDGTLTELESAVASLAERLLSFD